VRGFFVKDVNTLELEHWDLKGVPCSMVVLDGTGGTNDAYVCEIPAGGKIKPQRHMYEEMVYVTKGYGATSVWQRDGKKHTFEWGPGSMFRDAAQRRLPALQRQWQRSGALLRGDQLLLYNEPVSQS
jgi:Cupin domain.